MSEKLMIFEIEGYPKTVELTEYETIYAMLMELKMDLDREKRNHRETCKVLDACSAAKTRRREMKTAMELMEDHARALTEQRDALAAELERERAGGTPCFMGRQSDRIRDLEAAARDLLQYLDDHDWGHVPEGATADRLRDLVAAPDGEGVK